jgi:hypothetical protein
MALLFEIRQRLSQGFSALWARYPNKNAKKDAQKAFGQVVTTPAIEDEVHRALDWQIRHWETLDWYQPPYLATYLRQERFRDEPPTPKRPTRSLAIVKGSTPEQTQQQDVTARIQCLISRGMDPEDAKQQVYRELGWIKE